MLKLSFKIIAFSVVCISAQAQSTFNWQVWPDMPEPVSNNAVAGAVVGDTAFVYSFSGIDTTKSPEGIHSKCFRLNTTTLQWQTISPLPSGPGRIASGASTVNGVIYVIGGYQVLSNFNEVSLNYVHRWDVEENTFLQDAEPIPIPIDDHVQAVWRDSLIFIVGGWSNTGNVSAVQIYNTYYNTWAVGTPLPTSNAYRAFGASGAIVGDTIYYNGGATGFSFNSTANLRKGVINPLNPTEIEWTLVGQNPGDAGYRMASMSINENVFWIGGSGVTYNFDGIAYNGSGGVEPLSRVLEYRASAGEWFDSESPFGVMDLRGIASIGNNQFVICGGMGAGQNVQATTYLLEYMPDPLATSEFKNGQTRLFPNPAASFCSVESQNAISKIELYNSQGVLVMTIDGGLEGSIFIPLENFSGGVYYLKCHSTQNQSDILKLIKL